MVGKNGYSILLEKKLNFSLKVSRMKFTLSKISFYFIILKG